MRCITFELRNLISLADVSDGGGQVCPGTEVVLVVRLEQDGPAFPAGNAPVFQLGDDVAELTHHLAADGVSLLLVTEGDGGDAAVLVLVQVDAAALVSNELGFDGLDVDVIEARALTQTSTVAENSQTNRALQHDVSKYD